MCSSAAAERTFLLPAAVRKPCRGRRCHTGLIPACHPGHGRPLAHCQGSEGAEEWELALQLGRGLLTRATWTVNSTPMPTEAMRMTTGMALSLMPISPMMPKSSTAIVARMETWGWGWGQ